MTNREKQDTIEGLRKDATRWRTLMAQRIEHSDDRDMQPVFEIVVDCPWTKRTLQQAIDDVIRHSGK
jgi:CHASE3 domain sensor protein